MKKIKKTKNPNGSSIGAAYRHFGMRLDPFTTLSLGGPNLDYFVGRSTVLERVSSDMLSLSNVGVAGEPGMGKSSVLRVLQSKVPKTFHQVRIGVPMDDAGYFLSEVLREMLAALPKITVVNFPEISRQLERGELSKNAVLSRIRFIVGRLKKPILVFVDDLEKIKGDRIRHLTRSERTLQLLEELKPLLEVPKMAFVVSLQEEFYAKVRMVVKEGGEPTVLGLFKNIVLVEKFSQDELGKILEVRLKKAGHREGLGGFIEPEALTLALALSFGNPRRFLYLLSEAMYRGFARRGARVEYQDLFEAVNEHLKLDLTCKKLLYFLAKSGRVVSSNQDLLAFMGLDTISLARRLEILAKNGLAQRVDVADGAKVYALPGLEGRGVSADSVGQMRVSRASDGERIFHLSPQGESPEET